MEYLVSSELLLNIIPKHKDFPTVNSGRGDLKQIYKSLRKVSDETISSQTFFLNKLACKRLRVKSINADDACSKMRRNMKC